jgi:hypothetical protein
LPISSSGWSYEPSLDDPGELYAAQLFRDEGGPYVYDSEPSGMGTMAFLAQMWIALVQSRPWMQPAFMEMTFLFCAPGRVK